MVSEGIDMTFQEADRILREYGDRSTLSEEEESLLMEALEFMIHETDDYVYAQWLGGIYYEKRIFDQALKYYELAEKMGSHWAWNGLGYIWYYGRTGTVDYDKAFDYFSKVINSQGDEFGIRNKVEARFKIADMYKNGYHVEKDYDRYVDIIEELYSEIKDGSCGDPFPEVKVRLASIRAKQGRKEEAVELYLDARKDLVDRLANSRFFGDLNRMKWLIGDLYELIDFNEDDFDLYDLFHLLKEEHLVSFLYEDKKYEIESVKEGDEMKIRFNDVWYRNIDEFFQKADLEEASIEHEYLWIEEMKIER